MNNNSKSSPTPPPPPSQPSSLQSLFESSNSATMKLWNQTTPTSMRKLTRTDSTYEDDSFDDSTTSMRDIIPSHLQHLQHHHLGHLNRRHHVLRQQWFSRKNSSNNNNNLVNRLRRTTSNSSSSSSLSSSSSSATTSSGISSANNIYSSTSSSSTNNVNSISFASSFSSSFSATLSSLSESCDQQSLSSCDSPIPATTTTTVIDTCNNSNSICDYPKILRKSSFKNKLIHCYKPYNYGKSAALNTGSVRRYSLQLHLKKNNKLESLLSSSSSLMMISPTPPSSRPNSRSSIIKNSKSCHQITGHHHYHCHQRDRRCLWATMAAMAAVVSNSVVSKPTAMIKSNPSSPNKEERYFSETNFPDSMNEEDETIASILIDNDSSSPQPLQQQQQAIGSDINVPSQLIRSKSLDDLQTLFCCPNLCAVTVATGSCNAQQPVATIFPGSTMDNIMLSSSNHQPTTISTGCHNGMIHYSSFNPIPCDHQSSSNNNTPNDQIQPKITDQLVCPFFSQQQQQPPSQLNPDHSYQSLNPLMMKMTSISSNQINVIDNDDRFSSTSTSTSTNNNNNHSNNNNNNDSNNCDIDHVMRKIRSLHV
uniref:Uncharacterized protein n=1 Tax=Dermatophagoides pteronyssinus TaxID=6956 RepID=A0A6P6XMD8_DERPT|nr:putative uncharacterized protein DDB_G0277255 [Dermatophagoides pteronyssinus]